MDKPKHLEELFPTSSKQLAMNSTPWRPSTGLHTKQSLYIYIRLNLSVQGQI